MIKTNPNFNYNLSDKIINLKQFESDNVMDTINHIMEIFHYIYFTKTKKHVYFLGKELKFTQEIDPSHFLVLKYAISNIQDVVIELPLIKNDYILINGNAYNPMIQMIDRPLILKNKNKSAVFSTNLGNMYTTEIRPDKVIRLITSVNKKFSPPLLVWLIGFIGLNAFEEMTGVKIVIKQEYYDMTVYDFLKDKLLYFNKKNIKEEYDNEKFHTLLDQLDLLVDEELQKPPIVEKLLSVTVKDLAYKNKKGWEFWLHAYDGARVLSKIAVHQALVPMLDIFSANFMKYKDIPKEFLRLFSNEIEPKDPKDITVKRFRCYEIFLITFLKHVYNLGMNTMYNKITSVSKEKRLRIYDNAVSSHLTNYDGYRNNSIMRLSELFKISQTGEGGYTGDMFVGAARDIHESQYGTLCPVTTPDREKCGVTLHLAPSKVSQFDNMYYWPKNSEHKENRLPLRSMNDYIEEYKTPKPETDEPIVDENKEETLENDHD